MFPRTKSQKSRVSTSAQQRQGIRKDTSSHQTFIVSHTRCPSSSLALSRSMSEVKSSTTVHFTRPRLQPHSTPQPGATSELVVVDRVFIPRGKTSQVAPASSNNRVRCIEKRLGSPFNSPGSDNWRNLESRGSSTPHQLVGAESCILGATGVCSESLQCPHSPLDGQHGSYSLFESFRRNQILRSVLTTGNLNLELVSAKRDKSTCRPFILSAKCESRLCVQELEQLQRLDTGSGGILPDTEEIWPIFNRSVCIVSKHTTPEVLQLETKSQYSSSRRSSAIVEPLRAPICFSSICPDREMSAEGPRGKGQTTTHDSSS